MNVRKHRKIDRAVLDSVSLPILGAKAIPLKPFDDDRGRLFELSRRQWNVLPELRQWNYVTSRANTLRGVHVHLDHDDYVVVLQGCLNLGLHDIRPESPTAGVSLLATFDSGKPTAVVIPRGVLHGFCFVQETSYVYGLTAGWSSDDDLGCHWSDPALGIDWPVRSPILSTRDRHAGSLDELQTRLIKRRSKRSR